MGFYCDGRTSSSSPSPSSWAWLGTDRHTYVQTYGQTGKSPGFLLFTCPSFFSSSSFAFFFFFLLRSSQFLCSVLGRSSCSRSSSFFLCQVYLLGHVVQLLYSAIASCLRFPGTTVAAIRSMSICLVSVVRTYEYAYQ